MNSLTVISVAALVASGSASLLAYNGVYGGHHGLLGAYPYAGYSGLVPYAYAGGLPAAAPLSLKTPVIKTLAPTPISYNVAPAPVSYNVAPAPVSYNVAPAPVSYNLAPAPASYNVDPFAPVAPVQSQYHAQDEIGQYSFGYAGGPSSRAESRDAFGVVRGSYNYVDSEGKVQTQHYVADALGFRASGTNLPMAPDAPLAALPGPVPEPVQDTAESRDAFGVVRGSYNYVDSEGKVQTQHYVADALGFRASGTNLPVAPDAPLAALPGPVPRTRPGHC
ncbi:Cuticle protein 6 [Penaeus vannamei]|uniref:Cuticle protein 6 n=1 Tax=Penaeus vannamei TaxID=6689 RepID=A0A423U8W7_PENVA|nr:Cuticle protein 6 [Penaeus vannamei]